MVNQYSYLKEQSQFAPARIRAKSFVKGDYDNKQGCGVEKNKPKQSQFETPVAKEAAGMRGCREPLRGLGRRKTLTTQKA
jgi:hypothetical protein